MHLWHMLVKNIEVVFLQLGLWVVYSSSHGMCTDQSQPPPGYGSTQETLAEMEAQISATV
jgi:hypothetical protein